MPAEIPPIGANTWRKLQKLADAAEPDFAKMLAEALAAQTWGSNLQKKLTAALTSGNAAKAIKMTFAAWQDTTYGLKPFVAKAVQDVITASVQTFHVGRAFDVVNKNALAWAQHNAATLITAMDDDAKHMIRQMVTDGFTQRLTAPDLARRLVYNGLGLNHRQAAALANYRARLVAAELPAASVIRLTQRRRDKMVRYRSRMISRTETMRASNMGLQVEWEWRVQRKLIDPQRVRKRWIVTPDDRLCPYCRTMSGKTTPIANTFANPTFGAAIVPPLHPQCVIGSTRVRSRRPPAAISDRPYDGPVYVLHVAGLPPLTITPNHPVLTRGGWVPAARLRVGDKLLCDRRWAERRGLYEDDEDDVPPRIEDVARAFAESSEMASVEMPVTREDFHGDALDGEVCVVRTDRPLWHDSRAAREQRGAEHDLRFAHAGRVPLASLRDLESPQPPPDDAAVNPVALGERVLGDAADVVGRELVRVELQTFHGRVFNLDSEGAYAAHGVIIHNCRCAVALQRVDTGAVLDEPPPKPPTPTKPQTRTLEDAAKDLRAALGLGKGEQRAKIKAEIRQMIGVAPRENWEKLGIDVMREQQDTIGPLIRQLDLDVPHAKTLASYLSDLRYEVGTWVIDEIKKPSKWKKASKAAKKAQAEVDELFDKLIEARRGESRSAYLETVKFVQERLREIVWPHAKNRIANRLKSFTDAARKENSHLDFAVKLGAERYQTMVPASLGDRLDVHWEGLVDRAHAGNGRYKKHKRTEVALEADTSKHTVVHELGHTLEYQHTDLRREVRDYLKANTRKKLVDIFGDGKEWSYQIKNPLAIAEKYTAKQYTFKAQHKGYDPMYTVDVHGNTTYATEVISMGLEAMSRDPLGFMRDQPEFFRFILRRVIYRD